MRNFTLNIDFPALDRLVTYLEDQDSTQAKVDEVTAEVDALTTRLQQSGGHLDEVLAAQQ